MTLSFRFINSKFQCKMEQEKALAFLVFFTFPFLGHV
jgi:hypothetical protein